MKWRCRLQVHEPGGRRGRGHRDAGPAGGRVWVQGRRPGGQQGRGHRVAGPAGGGVWVQARGAGLEIGIISFQQKIVFLTML